MLRLYFFACLLSSSGLEAERRPIADAGYGPKVVFRDVFHDSAKRKGSGTMVEIPMVPLHHCDTNKALCTKSSSRSFVRPLHAVMLLLHGSCYYVVLACSKDP